MADIVDRGHRFTLKDMEFTVAYLKKYLADLPDDTRIYITHKQNIRLDAYKHDPYDDEDGMSLYFTVE